MSTITIGIMPQAKMRRRTLDIARGKYKPKPGEPKIWFPSMRSVAEVLSDENRALLHVIRQSRPRSLGELSQITGRQVSNLSRTLKTMSNYGLVDLKRSEGSKQLRPVVKAREFKILAAA